MNIPKKKECCDFCGGKLPHPTIVQNNDRVRCYNCFSKDDEYKKSLMERNYSEKNLEAWK